MSSPSPFAISTPGQYRSPETSLRTVPPIGVHSGRLVVVGSGIKSIGGFTLEAISEIKHADKVFFAVADPATERFILENNPKAVDLYSLYDDDKNRSDTYVQMAEVLLREVRNGHHVVGVFYGHPGVFVNPSHRAIAIARSEGHIAHMYAGVSAEDCLFAEIGVDPSRPGCQTIEATDLLLRNRTLLTDSHVIIFQVGCVGLIGFDFKGFKNVHFPILVERLIKDYGENHQVVSFRDSQVRYAPSDVRRFRLKDLFYPEVQKTVTGLTTFYLPPKDLRQTDPAMSQRLGLKIPPKNSKAFFGPFPTDHPYTQQALKAVKALDTHQLPANYRKLRATRDIYDALKRLALEPRARTLYAKDKNAFIAPHLDLRPAERRALLSGRAFVVNASMKASPADEADRFVQKLLRDPGFSKKWAVEIKKYPGDHPETADKEINAWLFENGFDISRDDVLAAWERMKSRPLNFYAGIYNTQVDKEVGPTLTITSGGVVYWGATKIKPFIFNSNKLSWSQSKTNPNTVAFEFKMLIDDKGKPPPKGTYVGPYFSGTIQTNDITKNVRGRVGDFPPTDPSDNDPPPNAGTKFSQYNSTYSTAILNSAGKWEWTKDEFVVDDPTATYQGKAVHDYTFNNSAFNALTKNHNDWNISVFFYTSTSAKSPGVHFYGKRWAADEPVPAKPNFLGQIGVSSDAGKDAVNAYHSTFGLQIAMGLVNAVISAVVFAAVTKAIEKITKWWKERTPEAEQEMNQAQEELANQNDVQDEIEALEGDVVDEEINIDDIPQPPEPPIEVEAVEEQMDVTDEITEVADEVAEVADEVTEVTEVTEVAEAEIIVL